MGAMCVALLVKGAIDLPVPVSVYPVYCIFMLIWTFPSFRICPVQDGRIKGFGIVLDLLVGAFAGAGLAFPAFVVMQFQESSDLGPSGFVDKPSRLASLGSTCLVTE